ncbi:hypothetical protein PV726_39210 [Streptomyces europaeiscabiei]|nr:hypothetical protein [Streptomyces europaeiscabiei]MDX3696247.1 hypothetical protein [Streptomyces europaeiscabiei]
MDDDRHLGMRLDHAGVRRGDGVGAQVVLVRHLCGGPGDGQLCRRTPAKKVMEALRQAAIAQEEVSRQLAEEIARPAEEGM